MKAITVLWLEKADYDLKSARDLFATEQYLHVGFFCQQAIEKALKARIAQSGVSPLYSHNLSKLAEQAGLFSQMSRTQKDLLNSLSPLYIHSRYIDEEDRVSPEMDNEQSALLLAQTEELYEWIKATL